MIYSFFVCVEMFPAGIHKVYISATFLRAEVTAKNIETHLKIVVAHAVISAVTTLLMAVVCTVQLFALGFADLRLLILPPVVAGVCCVSSLTLYTLANFLREYIRVPEKYKKALGILYVLLSTVVTLMVCIHAAYSTLSSCGSMLVIAPELHLNNFLGLAVVLLVVGVVVTTYRMCQELITILRSELIARILGLASRSRKSGSEERRNPEGDVVVIIS